MSVTGGAESAARLTRNRWPSEDTAYCCLLTPGMGPPESRFPATDHRATTLLGPPSSGCPEIRRRFPCRSCSSVAVRRRYWRSGLSRPVPETAARIPRTDPMRSTGTRSICRRRRTARRVRHRESSGKGTAFVAGDRQNPQVSARLRILAAEQQKASIGGPIVCRFVLIRFQQQFIGSSAAR